MDITFVQEQEAAAKAKRRRSAVLARVGRVFAWLLRSLFSTPLPFRKKTLIRVEDMTPAQRFWRGLSYRLLFVPSLLALIAATMVFTGTHPISVVSEVDPNTRGLYYDKVDFVGDDGMRLTGWLLPVVDARAVVTKKDKVLRGKYPAVVLAHDYAHTPAQVLPLLGPLHEEGMVVLAVGLRGTGLGRPSGSAFGLREDSDVRAAVEMLRRRPFVDPERIAVVGIGTGANAALLAASQDPKIKALIVVEPVQNAEQAIARRIGPDIKGLRWMQPLCKWSFEIAYHVDIEDLAMSRFEHLMTERPTLVLGPDDLGADLLRPEAIERVRAFARTHLQPPTGAVAGTARELQQ
jgi:hypothetical protein